MPPISRKDQKLWKAITWNYDYIFGFSDEVNCPYYLTEREVQALLTFMETMSWVTRWHSDIDTPLDADAIAALHDNLVDKLLREEDCPSDPCEEGCIDYLPNAGFIRYEPNDPFRTPTFVPPGYTYIPWYTNPAIPLPGVIPTDAMVNQIAVAAPALPLSGFPRFSFEFDGRGEVEIELVNVPAGGFCIVALDLSVIGFKVVNTSSNLLDIISIAGILAALGFDTEDANIVDTDIVEIDVETVGHHRIDVTFLPNLGGETLLGFGGGLRRITFCGPIQAVEEMYLQRRSPDDDCLIEQSTDGGITWQEAWRMDNCCGDTPPEQTRIVDFIVEKSPDGVTWTPIDDDPRFIGPTLPPRTGGDSKCDSAQSAVDMITIHFEELSASVNAGASVTAIIAALVALFAVMVSFGTLTPLLLPLASALFWAGSAAIDAALTSTVYDELKCLIFCNSETDGSYTESGWQSLRTQIVASSVINGLAQTLLYDYVSLLGSVGMSNAASYNPTADGDCADCLCNPACVSPDWILVGSLVAMGDGWIEVQADTAPYGAAPYMISYGAPSPYPNDDFCCQLCDIEIVSGTQNGAAYRLCDGTPVLTQVPTDQLFSVMDWGFNESTAVMRFTFDC